MIMVSIDLSDPSLPYIEGEHDRIIKSKLADAGLLSDDFVYTVFNFMRAEQVAETGRTVAPEEDAFFAFTRQEIVWDNECPNCLRGCVKMYNEPGIAVYDTTQVRKAYHRKSGKFNSDFGYEFKQPGKEREALKGIVQLITE